MPSAWCIEALGVAAGHGAAPTTTSTLVQATHIASAKVFLLSQPNSGVYTCARASAARSSGEHFELVLWPFHLDRLAAGIHTLHRSNDNDDASNAAACQRDSSDSTASNAVEALQCVTTELSERVLRHCEAQSSSRIDDLMLTVLWWRPPEAPLAAGYNISVHVCTMPTPSSMQSTVLIHGAARDNAACKHTQWITERVPLEQFTSQVAAARTTPIHETILSTYDTERGDSLLLEGLITNFFVVIGGTVHTAADDVLLGSTRELVLRACAELGIPVVLAPPRLSERSTWSAAFVTSAVRVAISVTRVLWQERAHDAAIQEFELADSAGIVARIRQHIIARHFFLSA